jgi:hypothetical protein
VEAIRVLMAVQAQRPLRADTDDQPGQVSGPDGPDDLRARFARHTIAALVAELASLRPRPGSTAAYATRIALRELGRYIVPGTSDKPDLASEFRCWRGGAFHTR